MYMGFTGVFDAPNNPFPGKIFTDKSEGPGIDYAAECRPHIDYADDMVSAELFMATLSGDKAEVTKLTGVENPKVIESTSEDTIFVYYMDHGSIGVCEVGKSDLRETTLMETIDKMFTNKQYKKMVFYFEACHSGSMFRKLPADKNVYAMTGSDAEHSAWMSSCPPDDIVDGKSFNTCLGAYFDNFWMQKVTDDGSDITLTDMFTHVHDETAKVSDQNVSQFGDIDGMGGEVLSEYIGDYKSEHGSFKKEGLVAYADVPMHLAKWSAIRATSNSNDALLELKKTVHMEAVKEISVMRLARVYYKNDKAANESLKNRPASYDQDCVAELTMGLIGQCGYTLPLRDSHVNVLENICQNGDVSINFDLVC